MRRKATSARSSSWIHSAFPRCFDIEIPDVAREAGWLPPASDPRITGVCHVRQWFCGLFVSSDGNVYAVGEHVFRIDRQTRRAEWIGTFDRLNNELLGIVDGRLLTADSWLSKPGVYLGGVRLDIPDSLGCPEYAHSDPAIGATVVCLKRGMALLGPIGDVMGVCQLSGGAGRPNVARWKYRQASFWQHGVLIGGHGVWNWNPKTDELVCLSRRSELLCNSKSQALVRKAGKTLMLVNADGSTAFRWREALETRVEHAVLHETGAWLITSGHFNDLNREDGGLRWESYPFARHMTLDVIDDVASRLGDRFVLAADCPSHGGSIVFCESRDVHWCPWSAKPAAPVLQTDRSLIRDAVWLDDRYLLIAGEYGDIYSLDLGQDLARIANE